MSIPQSVAYTVLMKAYLSTDHVSAATGKTLAVKLSKAGAAFADPSAGASNATEVANGWYSFALSTTDTGTVGDLVVRLTGTGVDDAERILQVVNANTGGFAALPNAAANATGGLPAAVVRGGTAQAGSATSLTLDAGASATTDLYRGLLLVLTGGTGAGQARTISSYNGATKIATVDRSWFTNPDGTTTFVLLSANGAALGSGLTVNAGVPQTIIRSGTAQAGSTSNTIKLDTGASATNSLYVNNLVQITSGTGLGQTRTILAYNGTTKVATVDRAWSVVPDATSGFQIVASIASSTFSDQGVAQAGGATSITLASTASATNSLYVGSQVTILSGTGAGQTKEITAYNGTTKVATVDSAWSVNPDATSGYAVIPVASTQSGISAPTAAEVATAVWTDLLAGSDFGVSGSVGALVAANTVIVSSYSSGQDPATLVLAATVRGMTVAQILKNVFATTAGKLPSGAGTATEAWKGPDQATTEVTFTVDASGNRTAVVYAP